MSNISRSILVHCYFPAANWTCMHWLSDTSATRYFGTGAKVSQDTSAPDQGKVETLRTQDNPDETQLHRWFGLNLVPNLSKWFGAEVTEMSNLDPGPKCPDTSAPILWCLVAEVSGSPCTDT